MYPCCVAAGGVSNSLFSVTQNKKKERKAEHKRARVQFFCFATSNWLLLYCTVVGHSLGHYRNISCILNPQTSVMKGRTACTRAPSPYACATTTTVNALDPDMYVQPNNNIEAPNKGNHREKRRKTTTTNGKALPYFNNRRANGVLNPMREKIKTRVPDWQQQLLCLQYEVLLLYSL